MFLHNFMFLIDTLENGVSGRAAELLHTFMPIFVFVCEMLFPCLLV